MKTIKQFSVMALMGVLGLVAASCSKGDDDDNVNGSVPTTKQEAINMLKGQWRPTNPASMTRMATFFAGSYLDDSDEVDETYVDGVVADINDDGMIFGVHISDKAPVEKYHVMAGNYFGMDLEGVSIIPDATDVTKGLISLGGGLSLCYENLNNNSVRVYLPDDFFSGFEAGEDADDEEIEALMSIYKFDEVFTRMTTPVGMLDWSKADHIDWDNHILYTQTSSTSCKVYEQDELYYNHNDVKKITIPETVNINGRTCMVTAIGKNSLNLIENLEEVVLPAGITEIEEYAFSVDKNLQKINFPGKLRTIGEHAFAETGFREIELNEGLETVGYKAFTGMQNEVQKLVLPSTLKTIGGSAFGTFNDHTMNSCHYRDVYSHIRDVENIDYPDRSHLEIFQKLSIETLHVPVGTMSSYGSHDQFMWTTRNIVEDADL